MSFPHLFRGFLKSNNDLSILYTSGGQHQVLNLKKPAVIIVLVSVLLTSFAVFNPTLAQTNEEQRLKAESLLNILGNVNTTVSEAFARLDAKNIPVPTYAVTNYNQGIAHAQEAVNLIDQENYSEASREAIKAMQSLKKALIILEEASPIEPTESELTAEQVISLKANITRAYEYVERLENLTIKARDAGYSTTDLESSLLSARNHLKDASDKLQDRDLAGAAEELRTARTLLVNLKELYERLANSVKISNTEKYLEAAEARVSESKNNVTNSSSLSPENKTNALVALNNSEISLENARDLIDENRVDEAIDELEEAKRWEDESLKYLPSLSATASSVDVANNNLSREESTASG